VIYARLGPTPWEWLPVVKLFDPDPERAWGAGMMTTSREVLRAYLINSIRHWDAADGRHSGSPFDEELLRVVLMRSQIEIDQETIKVPGEVVFH
jgi:hypothetical protein